MFTAKQFRAKAAESAGLMGNVLQSVEPRGQIARFLHKRKDQEASPDCVSKWNRTK